MASALDSAATADVGPAAFVRGVERLVRVRPDEAGALLWACAYNFALLSAWYVLRPLRDELGIVGGTKNLPWLFTATLVAMFLANPLFGALVARWPRRRFIPAVYRFFQVNLLLFAVLLLTLPKTGQVHAARAFYVWASVFNLFVLSVFWGFMADLFSSEQGGRLFGVIAVGGTLGAIGGAAAAGPLAQALGPPNLLWVAAALLEVAVLCVRQLGRTNHGEAAWHAHAAAPAAPVARPALAARPAAGTPTVIEPAETAGEPAARAKRVAAAARTAFAGMWRTVSSPYLLGICGYMFLYTLTSTFLYFEQAHLVEHGIHSSAERTAFFARIDLYVNILAIVLQILFTSRIIAAIGLGPTAALVPLITLAGFGGLAFAPSLGLLMLIQVLRRAGDYATARPAREVFYTVVSREEKYKAKSFIDTFVYRGGDTLGAWLHGLLTRWLGGIGLLAGVALPLAGIWAGLGVILGWRARQRAARQAVTTLAAVPVSDAPGAR